MHIYGYKGQLISPNKILVIENELFISIFYDYTGAIALYGNLGIFFKTAALPIAENLA